MPSSIRILVVEDEFLISRGLSQQLERLGYKVVGTAKDGVTGVAQALELQPDLVFMDIGMPGLDGIQACKEIMEKRPVPIIMLTAYDDAQRLDEAKAAGAAGYVVKPTTEHRLRAAIEKVMVVQGEETFPEANE